MNYKAWLSLVQREQMRLSAVYVVEDLAQLVAYYTIQGRRVGSEFESRVLFASQIIEIDTNTSKLNV